MSKYLMIKKAKQLNNLGISNPIKLMKFKFVLTSTGTNFNQSEMSMKFRINNSFSANTTTTRMLQYGNEKFQLAIQKRKKLQFITTNIFIFVIEKRGAGGNKTKNNIMQYIRNHWRS